VGVGGKTRLNYFQTGVLAPAKKASPYGIVFGERGGGWGRISRGTPPNPKNFSKSLGKIKWGGESSLNSHRLGGGRPLKKLFPGDKKFFTLQKKNNHKGLGSCRGGGGTNGLVFTSHANPPDDACWGVPRGWVFERCPEGGGRNPPPCRSVDGNFFLPTPPGGGGAWGGGGGGGGRGNCFFQKGGSFRDTARGGTGGGGGEKQFPKEIICLGRGGGGGTGIWGGGGGTPIKGLSQKFLLFYPQKTFILIMGGAGGKTHKKPGGKTYL